jgi:diketogulonate reductase-like aldo/keto reductase
MIPIIGARKMSQLNDNLASLSVNLTDDQLRRLDEASRPAPIFPNTFFDKEFVGAYVYGGVRDRIDA